MLYWLANRREQRTIARLEREVASLNVLCGALIESHTRARAAAILAGRPVLGLILVEPVEQTPAQRFRAAVIELAVRALLRLDARTGIATAAPTLAAAHFEERAEALEERLRQRWPGAPEQQGEEWLDRRDRILAAEIRHGRRAKDLALLSEREVRVARAAQTHVRRLREMER